MVGQKAFGEMTDEELRALRDFGYAKPLEAQYSNTRGAIDEMARRIAQPNPPSPD